MTRKDYIALSDALRRVCPMSEERIPQHAHDCEAVADVLGQSKGFDRERFLRACGAA